MRIEWLEAFQKTVETKSFTKASEQLHLSQPALSKQIRSLESYFGCQLFVRSATGVVLTKEGTLLLHAGDEILGKIQQVRKQLSELYDEKRLVIGSWPSIASSFLPQKFREENYRAGKISIKTSHTYLDLMSGLENQLFDGILMDDTYVEHDFVSEHLFAEPILLYVHKNHPLYTGQKEVAFDDIAGESFLSLPENCDCRTIIEKAFEKRKTSYKVSSEIEFGQSILGFIAANLGISFLPQIFSSNMSVDIRSIEVKDFPLHRDISLITKDKETSKFIKKYLVI